MNKTLHVPAPVLITGSGIAVASAICTTLGLPVRVHAPTGEPGVERLMKQSAALIGAPS